MIVNIWYFLHNNWHICFYLIPTVVVALIAVIVGLTHGSRQKKREEEFIKQLDEKYINSAAEGAEIPAPDSDEQ